MAEVQILAKDVKPGDKVRDQYDEQYMEVLDIYPASNAVTWFFMYPSDGPFRWMSVLNFPLLKWEADPEVEAINPEPEIISPPEPTSPDEEPISEPEAIVPPDPAPEESL